MAALTGYRVISSENLEDFVKQVEALPMNPWRPAGSIATSVIKSDLGMDNYIIIYTQAFVREG